jgi:transposase
MEKIDARSISPSAQEHLRRMAVKAVMEGAKQKEVAQMLGVTRHTICRWLKAYRRQGKAALKAKKKGRPKGGKLLPWQAAQIAKAVMDHHPEQLKLPFFLWTREAVALLIRRRFGVQLSVWTVGRYLQRWGFTPQKPARRAWEQNPEQVHAGWSKNTPAFAGKPSGRRPRFTGVMKWGSGPIMPWDAPMASKVRHQRS